MLVVCHYGLMGNKLLIEHEGHGFYPRYRQIHSGSDDHLKLQSPVVGSCLQYQADVYKCSLLSLYLSVRGVSVTRECIC